MLISFEHLALVRCGNISSAFGIVLLVIKNGIRISPLNLHILHNYLSFRLACQLIVCDWKQGFVQSFDLGRKWRSGCCIPYTSVLKQNSPSCYF